MCVESCFYFFVQGVMTAAVFVIAAAAYIMVKIKKMYNLKKKILK